MVLRLFLCVLIAAFGCQPAAAMPCHEVPRMTMPMQAGVPAERHHEAIPAHACVGCIPPETLRAGVLPALSVTPATPFARALAALAPDAGTPPALPPPRA